MSYVTERRHIGSTMNKQRREHSHPSYVCFSAAHDFAVGDVGAVY